MMMMMIAQVHLSLKVCKTAVGLKKKSHLRAEYSRRKGVSPLDTGNHETANM